MRALMMLALVPGCGPGWIVRRAHFQRDAVAALKRAGGHVWYDWYSDDHGFFIKDLPPGWPKWLVDRIGVDYFGDVVHGR
jgi:internalin A